MSDYFMDRDEAVTKLIDNGYLDTISNRALAKAAYDSCLTKCPTVLKLVGIVKLILAAKVLPLRHNEIYEAIAEYESAVKEVGGE